jgi:hypothetical protein
MDWQELFESHILERGFRYYRQGFVEDFCESKDSVRATVQGSNAYEVLIEIKDKKIIDMNCECPYADEGNYCKHMAAVLFYMEGADKDGFEGKQNRTNGVTLPEALLDKGKSAGILVEEADENLVRNFLTGILENDEKLLNRFRNALNCEISASDMKRYKNQINTIFRKFAGRHDFIDYYHADGFITELEDFLYNDIAGIIKNRQYEAAFELTNYIFVKTADQDIDDSAGGTGMLAEKCYEIWLGIAEHCSKKFKEKMFQWYTDHLNGSVIDYMEVYIERIMFESFKEDEFLEKKLRLAEDKVNELKKEDNSRSSEYRAAQWVLNVIKIMQDQKKPQDLIDQYCIENLKFNSVRKYYVAYCINSGHYETAICVLKEGKEIDKDLPGLVADYSLQLKNLYKQTGDNRAYEDELWSLVLKYRTGDVELFRELKSLYSQEEWVEKREIIFQKLPVNTRVDKLYEEEKLYDRLLKVVLDSLELYRLTEYEYCLQKLYPAELLMKYEKEVQGMIKRVSDRKRYQEIVSFLGRMKKYPEGTKKVKEIVSDWQIAYKNRPAMMDELQKL